jgi:hypothetical protein
MGELRGAAGHIFADERHSQQLTGTRHLRFLAFADLPALQIIGMQQTVANAIDFG